MFSKVLKFQLTFVVCLAVLSASSLTSATETETENVEDSTVSPIADMAIIESEMKTSTERPPTMDLAKQEEKPSSQRHTVADFIIHPLIAFKPRNPEEESAAVAGKQAGGSTSSTTPSPWQLFGFNAGQGISNSVSSLAGSVTGWINDRIQFPGLMESPVRESTTSSSSTTTTTPRPDVVVRVQHKQSTRRPVIAIGHRNRPNRPNFDSEENDDEYDYEDNEDNDENEDNENSNEDNGDNESSNEKEDGDGSEEEEDNEVGDKDEDEGEEQSEETADDDEEENYSQRPNNRRRPVKKNNQRRGNRPQNPRRRVPNRRQRPQAPLRRRPVNNNNNNNNGLNDDDVLNDDEYSGNDNFYYGARPSTKRSQSNSNFIQRSQQQLLNQIRQLTRGQTPGEIGSAIRRAQANNGVNRRQQATLFVNRNGQTIYMAPELAQFGQPQYQQVYAQSIQPVVHKAPATNAFPQPPLTVPLKQKGQPVQYITIPWAQLGISPPNNIVSITEGIQAQPFILNIPQSAINTMQNQAKPGSANRRKKRPQLITADAVPLLADASIMDIFKPPQIPPSRTSSSSKPSTSITPVLVAAKPSSTKKTAILQQRIRPGTVVEMAPSMDDIKKSDETETTSSDEPKAEVYSTTGDKEYIIVGKDDEPGLTRQVEPVNGDARYVRLTGNSQYYDVLPRRRFTIRRGGRELAQSEDEKDQHIPVQVINDPSNNPQSDSKASESVVSQNPAVESPVPLTESSDSPIKQSENTQLPAETTTT